MGVIVGRSRPLLAGVLLLAAVAAGQDEAQRLVVLSPLPAPRYGVPVSVPLSRVRRRPGVPVLSDLFGQRVACQIDDTDGDRRPDELFFFCDFDQEPAARFDLTWAPAADVPQPPRQVRAVVSPGDVNRLAWESELQGYCLYGAAKLDLFGKLYVSRLTSDWFFGDPPHSPHRFAPGKGMDFLPVGATMGAGSIAFSENPADRSDLTRPWTQNSFRRAGLPPEANAEFSFEVLSNGPLRAVARTRIRNWHGRRGDYAVTIIHLIAAGQRWCESRVRFDQLPQDTDGVLFAAGFRELPGGEDFAEGDGWQASSVANLFDPAAAGVVADRVGLGLFYPPAVKVQSLRVEPDGPNHVVLLDVLKQGGVTLHHLGAWSRDGGITTPEAWTAGAAALSDELQHPAVVVVKD